MNFKSHKSLIIIRKIYITMKFAAENTLLFAKLDDLNIKLHIY